MKLLFLKSLTSPQLPWGGGLENGVTFLEVTNLSAATLGRWTGKGRQRETKGDKGRQKGDKGRQRETRGKQEGYLWEAIQKPAVSFYKPHCISSSCIVISALAHLSRLTSNGPCCWGRTGCDRGCRCGCGATTLSGKCSGMVLLRLQP